MTPRRVAVPTLSLLIAASLVTATSSVHARMTGPGAPTRRAAVTVRPGVAPLAVPLRLPVPRPPAQLGSRTMGGRLVVVAAPAPVRPAGPVTRYLVEVDVRLAHAAAEFTAVVDATLADPRGWATTKGRPLVRVDDASADFRVVLAGPDLADRLCRPLATNGRFSCFQRGRAVINARRWTGGAAAYPGDLDGYRRYVVNHEVGHALGHGHRRCPGPGRAAPVMVQQTKGLGGCRPNAWPTTA